MTTAFVLKLARYILTLLLTISSSGIDLSAQQTSPSLCSSHARNRVWIRCGFREQTAQVRASPDCVLSFRFLCLNSALSLCGSGWTPRRDTKPGSPAAPSPPRGRWTEGQARRQGQVVCGRSSGPSLRDGRLWLWGRSTGDGRRNSDCAVSRKAVTAMNSAS